jgi:hypothetical protein
MSTNGQSALDLVVVAVSPWFLDQYVAASTPLPGMIDP